MNLTVSQKFHLETQDAEIVRMKASALRRSRWYAHAHALRFGLGGLVTVLAGIIADTRTQIAACRR